MSTTEQREQLGQESPEQFVKEVHAAYEKLKTTEKAPSLYGVMTQYAQKHNLDVMNFAMQVMEDEGYKDESMQVRIEYQTRKALEDAKKKQEEALSEKTDHAGALTGAMGLVLGWGVQKILGIKDVKVAEDELKKETSTGETKEALEQLKQEQKEDEKEKGVGDAQEDEKEEGEKTLVEKGQEVVENAVEKTKEMGGKVQDKAGELYDAGKGKVKDVADDYLSDDTMEAIGDMSKDGIGQVVKSLIRNEISEAIGFGFLKYFGEGIYYNAVERMPSLTVRHIRRVEGMTVSDFLSTKENGDKQGYFLYKGKKHIPTKDYEELHEFLDTHRGSLPHGKVSIREALMLTCVVKQWEKQISRALRVITTFGMSSAPRRALAVYWVKKYTYLYSPTKGEGKRSKEEIEKELREVEAKMQGVEDDFKLVEEKEKLISEGQEREKKVKEMDLERAQAQAKQSLLEGKKKEFEELKNKAIRTSEEEIKMNGLSAEEHTWASKEQEYKKVLKETTEGIDKMVEEEVVRKKRLGEIADEFTRTGSENGKLSAEKLKTYIKEHTYLGGTKDALENFEKKRKQYKKDYLDSESTLKKTVESKHYSELDKLRIEWNALYEGFTKERKVLHGKMKENKKEMAIREEQRKHASPADKVRLENEIKDLEKQNGVLVEEIGKVQEQIGKNGKKIFTEHEVELKEAYRKNPGGLGKWRGWAVSGGKWFMLGMVGYEVYEVLAGRSTMGKITTDLAEIGGGFVPVVGTAMDLNAFWQGRDLSGRALSATERSTRLAFGVLGAACDVTAVVGIGLGARVGLGFLKGGLRGARAAKSTIETSLRANRIMKVAKNVSMTAGKVSLAGGLTMMGLPVVVDMGKHALGFGSVPLDGEGEMPKEDFDQAFQEEITDITT